MKGVFLSFVAGHAIKQSAWKQTRLELNGMVVGDNVMRGMNTSSSFPFPIKISVEQNKFSISEQCFN